MANRVVLGNANGEYGLYVSQKDDNVLSPNKQLSFDSRAFNGLPVHAFGEGEIAAPSGGASSRATSALSYTNLGFAPLFAVRYSFAGDISNGKATKVYSPSSMFSSEAVNDVNGQTEVETAYIELKNGGVSAVATSSAITITNRYGGRTVQIFSNNTSSNVPTVVTNQGAQLIKYAYIIFGVEDFTGGQGL
ncbi:hypothetical protein OAG26_00995 [Flavobacteriales bacterium]|nr:hypothetical protein [Flavobacteriales bacterium]